MNRKDRRDMEKKMGKESSQKLAEKIFQFEKLPNECSACTVAFDKKCKEMAMTWNVVVQDKDTIRLYCPKCWSFAKDVIREFEERNK